jgi:hypothetical protein
MVDALNHRYRAIGHHVSNVDANFDHPCS